ncbi:hypothetical protein ACFFF5_17765, partial [Lederbergia wuyishanensis]
MLYVPNQWKNREVERPRTFSMQDNGDGTITLIPAEGAVIEAGTPIIASNMNNIEEGIVGAYQALDEHEAERLQDGVHGLATTQNIIYYVDAVKGNDNNNGLTK